jgi:hypothetical protein
MEFIDLDDCVVSALKLIEKSDMPKIKLPKFKRPLVVGSGNAAVTGRILFKNSDAVFADESTYLSKLGSVDGGIIISASGGKHSPAIARSLRDKGLKSVLLTNNANALAREHVDMSFVFPKQAEPYTYNVSTYLSMIIGFYGENPEKIRKSLSKVPAPGLTQYDAYFFIVPDEFVEVREMILTKFDELFGPVISCRAFTEGQTEHAKTVTETEKELFVSIGKENKAWGMKRLTLPLPDKAGYAGMIATSYYFIGQIQKQNPQYFKKNIESYCSKVSKIFGQDIRPIVE